MDVTDVLRDRMQEPAGFQRAFTLSVAAHVACGAVILLAPHGWLGTQAGEPRGVMTISLGSAGEGPVNGGMTRMGGRPVQVATPPDEAPKRDTGRPPAVKTPAMTLPAPHAKTTKATPPLPVKQAPDDARGRTPTNGAEPIAGSTIAATGVRGQGFGMSTGGGPGSGSTLDVADFCCPEYLMVMTTRLRSAWMENQGARGECVIKFTIQRDGRLTDATIEKQSGNTTLDIAAWRAVITTKTLPPLPAQFPNPTLTVHLNFQYQ